MVDEFESIAESCRGRLLAKFSAREQGYKLSREIIRHAANAIRAMHRDQFDLARELLGRAEKGLEEVRSLLSGHADVLYGGFVQDAEKEYAEALATLRILLGEPLSGPEEMNISDVSYLNGLGEAVGEIRRHVLDLLRHGRTEECEDLLEVMEDIHSALVTMDFPDGMTGGLRRTTDVARGILEKTRGDLTLSSQQRQLAESLRRLERRLDPGGCPGI